MFIALIWHGTSLKNSLTTVTVVLISFRTYEEHFTIYFFILNSKSGGSYLTKHTDCKSSHGYAMISQAGESSCYS